MSLKFPILFATLAACTPQVDGNHNGTPLAQLEGTVQNMRTASINDAEVAIVWINSSGSPDIAGGETVEVEGNFPAAFRLSVYEPPVDALINSYSDGSRMGVAYIVSATAGTDFTDDESAEAGLLGMDPDHLLVYLPADIVAGSAVSTLLRGTPTAGFHLYNVGHLTEAESETRRSCEDQLPAGATIQELYDTCGGSPSFDDFLPTASDLETPLEVDLVDDLGSLDVPNWT